MRMSISLVILLLLPSTLASTGARNQTNEELLASIPLLWDSINKLKDDFDTFEEEDDTIEPPPDPNPVAALEDGPMPKSFELPLVMMYDSNVQASHGYRPSDVKTWVNRVVELTKPRLAALTPSSIRLNVTKVEHWPGRFKVNSKQLKKLALGEDHPNKKHLTMLLVGGTIGRRKGNAVLGSACREDGYAFGMLKDMKNDTKTARVLAHEIGHTLGMR